MLKWLVIIAITVFMVRGHASPSNVYGQVINITSVKQGLLILLDTQKPSGCTQSSNWLLIAKEDTVMISVALAMHMAGKNKATVYIDSTSTDSYCRVIQYDPHP